MIEVIAEALFATAAEISKNPLVKDVDNKFAKFKYVPIDSYYAAIPKIALKHGLFWRCKEQEVKVEGKTFFFKFGFDLFHKSGESVEDYDTVTIFHPAQGPQTAGSARSYAEKLFMRTCFKVVTGEKDSEYFHDQEPEDMGIPDADGSNNNSNKFNEQQATDAEEITSDDQVAHLDDFRKDFLDDKDAAEKAGLFTKTDDGIKLKEPADGNWSHLEDIIHTFMPRLNDTNGNGKPLFTSKSACAKGVGQFFKGNNELLQGVISKKSPETYDNILRMFKAAKTAALDGSVYGNEGDQDA